MKVQSYRLFSAYLASKPFPSSVILNGRFPLHHNSDSFSILFMRTRRGIPSPAPSNAFPPKLLRLTSAPLSRSKLISKILCMNTQHSGSFLRAIYSRRTRISFDHDSILTLHSKQLQRPVALPNEMSILCWHLDSA